MYEVEQKYAVTRNACKLCNPLGASLVLRGIERAMPLLHGSQGCATYIRRYLISHFKEPIDIASSNFSEQSAIFGGSSNLLTSIENVRRQYEPTLIGIATTCLSETIGDDVSAIINQYYAQQKDHHLPVLVHVSTPSYQGTHIDGFHATVKAVVNTLATSGTLNEQVTLLPNMVSPADLRHLKEIMQDFALPVVLLPDYSETLDGPLWKDYQEIPLGGTPIEAIKQSGASRGVIEFGTIPESKSAGTLLKQKFAVPLYRCPLPIGIKATDRFFSILQALSARPIPQKYLAERARLIDAYADAHKHAFGIKALVYGEEDLVASVAAFLSEFGMIPVLCASGSKNHTLEKTVRELIPDYKEKGITCLTGIDFISMTEVAEQIKPDIVIGNSKGFTLANQLNIPLIRIGFPIHDRIGGQRVLHLGYRGAQHLFDNIINTVIEQKQTASPVGYAYM